MIAPPGPLGLPDIASLLRYRRRDGRLAHRRAVPPAGRDRYRRDRRRPGHPGGRRRAQPGHGARRAGGPARAASGQRVRPDREHHLHHLPRHDRPGAGRGDRADRPPDPAHHRAHPRPARAARADRRDRRAVYRRGRAGPRLRRQPRGHGAGVRARSVRVTAPACTGPGTWRAGARTGPSSSSAAWTIRSRSAASGSSPARSRRFSAAHPGVRDVGRPRRGRGRAAAPDRLRDAGRRRGCRPPAAVGAA